MTAMIDYDAGNMRSVEKAFRSLGETPVITRDPRILLAADRVVLPGVGAFGDAMRRLEQYGLIEVIREIAGRGTPLLGICLGLQLLFESSEESPGVKGLGLCSGQIVRIPKEEGKKIPHMGWNSLAYGDASGKPASGNRNGRLFRGIPEHSYVYFVHSYYLKAEDPQIVTASTEYAAHIHASIEQGNLFGCQFHPEKSGSTGLAILKNFLAVGKEAV